MGQGVLMNIESAIKTLEANGLWHGHVSSCRALAAELTVTSVLSGHETKDIIRKAEAISRLGKNRHLKVLDAGASVGLWKRSASDAFGIERSLSSDAEEVPDGVIAIRRGAVVTVPEVPKEELGFYEDDPQLRELALRGSSCFGGWVSDHKECGACPLRGFCAETLKSRIIAEASAMTRELAASIAEAEAVAEAETVAEAVAEGVAEAEATESPQSLESGNSADWVVRILDAKDIMSVRKVHSPFTAHCSAECGKEIAAQSEGVSVAGHGFYHASCALRIFAS
jgi:hypothetical protein